VLLVKSARGFAVGRSHNNSWCALFAPTNVALAYGDAYECRTRSPGTRPHHLLSFRTPSRGITPPPSVPALQFHTGRHAPLSQPYVSCFILRRATTLTMNRCGWPDRSLYQRCGVLRGRHERGFAQAPMFSTVRGGKSRSGVPEG
jgi:hypothetical protein